MPHDIRKTGGLQENCVIEYREIEYLWSMDEWIGNSKKREVPVV